jgi:MoaA/NifB/PqqE/SkfB family radical SAM enzyme
MPNILLTQRCVRSCPYCFAQKHMDESAPDDILSWENLIYLADFLEASGERRFAILGGEPTLHPEFNNFLLYLLERNFIITVFTSGIMSPYTLQEAGDLFKSVPLDRLTFICNLNNPAQTPTTAGELAAVRRFLAAFGERVAVSFNIYRLDFDLSFIFQYINEFGLQRTIRLGLAHPIPNQKNLYIAPADMGQVIDRLFSYQPLMERFRLKPGFDCGFPLCLLSDHQLAWLYRFTGSRFEFGCGPAIDIGPDMTVWACFPLSTFHKKSIFEFNSLAEIHQYFQRLHDMVHVEAGGIFQECDACRFREERRCSGGCLAHLLTQFSQEVPLRLPEVYC